MAQTQRRPLPPPDRDDESDARPAAAIVASQDQALDALLDDIDQVLGTNAESFVRSFVQKGGQ